MKRLLFNKELRNFLLKKLFLFYPLFDDANLFFAIKFQGFFVLLQL